MRLAALERHLHQYHHRDHDDHLHGHRDHLRGRHEFHCHHDHRGHLRGHGGRDGRDHPSS